MLALSRPIPTISLRASNDLALQRSFVDDYTLAICCLICMTSVAITVKQPVVLYYNFKRLYASVVLAITCSIRVMLVINVHWRHFWQQKSRISSILRHICRHWQRSMLTICFVFLLQAYF